MGKGIKRLNALTVSRKLKRGYYNDGGGLYLQVGKHGGKSWVFRFRMRKLAADAGRLREMGSVHIKPCLWLMLARRRSFAESSWLKRF